MLRDITMGDRSPYERLLTDPRMTVHATPGAANGASNAICIDPRAVEG